MFARNGNSRKMKATLIAAAALMLAACKDGQPSAPTAQQSQQLNEAENMLNNIAQNEEGPEQRPGPSNQSN
jgi:hypothetical protein